jgi:hypothetical protein
MIGRVMDRSLLNKPFDNLSYQVNGNSMKNCLLG